MATEVSFIDRSLRRLAKVLIYISGAFLFCMMLHVVSDVAMRYLFNSPIPGTAEIVAHYYMVAAVFLPLPFVEMRNTGISVDLLYNMFGNGVRKAMLCLALLGQIFFFSILAYQSSIDAWSAFEILEYISVQIKITIWPASFFLPVGFSIACVASIFRLVQLFYRSDWEEVCHSTYNLDLSRESK